MKNFLGTDAARIILTAALSLGCFTAMGQPQSGSVGGVVTDSSGAVVPYAKASLGNAVNVLKTTETDAQGRFQFAGLAPGEYSLMVEVAGFARFEATGLRVNSGRTLTQRVRLALATVNSEVTVGEQSEVDVDPGNSAAAIVVQGSDLKALSDDRDRLAEDLQALAGPSIGPNGGEIFVDGFSGGKLPAKASIREIRVNQNPFSAEYDRLGFGRVEIFTKPGSDAFRGEAGFIFGDAALNSRNPFATEKPPYQRKMVEGNLAGPITKRSSFYLALERFSIQELSIINAQVLNSDLRPVPYRQSVGSPMTMTEGEGRVDYQLSTNHTLASRYFVEQRSTANAGLDTFTLPTRAAIRTTREDGFQVTETAVISPLAINEIRFQYRRDTSSSQPTSTGLGIVVPEAFSSGGSEGGISTSRLSRFEAAEVLSIVRGRNTLKLGGRLRTGVLSDLSMRNYNGSYLFNSLESYRLTETGLLSGAPAAQIRALGGGASQFSLTVGDPSAGVRQTDAGLFFQDDWRIRPRLTLTTGLRYEVQSNLADRTNFGPRVGIAWAPGGSSGRRLAGVIRVGFGLFFDRVGADLTLNALRLDGLRQRQYIVSAPDYYPAVPSLSMLAGNIVDQAIRVMDQKMHTPYIAQTAITYERQLPGKTTLSVTYSNSRGERVLRSRNINAPLPGTYNPLAVPSGIRPSSGGNVYQYESAGMFRQNQVLVNWNTRVSQRVSLLGYYAWGKARSNSDGAEFFPASSYSTAGEYARAGFDVRHRVMVGGSLSAPYGLILSPLVTVSSGMPFNITTGRDLNGDSIFNDRPAWASDLTGSAVVRTSYGAFDVMPVSGRATILRNIGNGPSQVVVNLRVARSFGFGERSSGRSTPQATDDHHGGPGGPGGPGGHGGGADDHGRGASGNRYTLTFSMAARNLLNTVNLAQPVGNLSSPLFGSSVAISGGRRGGGMSANRTLEITARFSF